MDAKLIKPKQGHVNFNPLTLKNVKFDSHLLFFDETKSNQRLSRLISKYSHTHVA